MATYVISDIHGCYDEFLLMLAKIDLKETDRLILAGDYIDRGKKNIEMLKWLEHCPENVTPIKGNHDAEYIENIQIFQENYFLLLMLYIILLIIKILILD